MIRPIKVFSFFHNSKLYFQDNKAVDLEKSVNFRHYNNVPKYITDKCVRVVNGINNCHFTLSDFKKYIFKLHMFNNKVTWKMIDVDEISEIKSLFSDERYKRDKNFVETTLKKLQSDISEKFNVNNLFDVNANGNNHLLDLMSKGVVSPIYYLITFNKHISDANLNKYDMSDSLIRLNETTKKINKY